MECLLVIDMQNEFTTDGKFSKNCIGNEILLQNICNLIAKFRENHKPIFFCKSIYTPKQRKHKQHKHKQQKFNSSENYSSFLKGTHLGKNICCEPNSENSEIHPIIRKKVLHNEEIIIKNFYSAFKNTDLEKLLSAQNIKTCFLSGVKTNVCLAATAQDAIELGLNVVLVQDCSAATTLELNQKGLQHMVELGASICQTKDIQFQLVKQFSHTFGEGDCFVYYNVLPKSISDVCFEALKKEVNWHQMYHGSRVVSRLVCVQGDIDSNGSKPLYRFPTDHFFQLEKWTPMAKKIRNILQEKLNACQCFGEKNALNHAKIQYYKDGNSYITAHSDKTCDIKRNSFIVNISFGATRTFVLRHKKKRNKMARIFDNEFYYRTMQWLYLVLKRMQNGNIAWKKNPN